MKFTKQMGAGILALSLVLPSLGLPARFGGPGLAFAQETDSATKILIERRDLSGALALFAGEVRPEAEVFFHAQGKAARVVFPNDGPFDTTSFEVPPEGVSKRIRADASHGVYIFHLESPFLGGAEHHSLLLTVAQEGIGYLGFLVQPIPWSVRAQLKHKSGQPLELQFLKSIANRGADLLVSRIRPGDESEVAKVSLGPEQRVEMMALSPSPRDGETIVIELNQADAGNIGAQSGGTAKIDILIEP